MRGLPSAPSPLLRCAALALAVVLAAVPAFTAGAHARALGQGLSVERALTNADATLTADLDDAASSPASLLAALPGPLVPVEAPQDEASPPSPPCRASGEAARRGALSTPPEPGGPGRPLRHLHCVYRL